MSFYLNFYNYYFCFYILVLLFLNNSFENQSDLPFFCFKMAYGAFGAYNAYGSYGAEMWSKIHRYVFDKKLNRKPFSPKIRSRATISKIQCLRVFN